MLAAAVDVAVAAGDAMPSWPEQRPCSWLPPTASSSSQGMRGSSVTTRELLMIVSRTVHLVRAMQCLASHIQRRTLTNLTCQGPVAYCGCGAVAIVAVAGAILYSHRVRVRPQEAAFTYVLYSHVCTGMTD
jgi:hypothetical protein